MGQNRPIFVVGAGPGGAAAAWTLARAGIRGVTLLERAVWPRNKACAGGLGPRALPWLRRYGLYETVAAAGVVCNQLLFTSPRGRQACLRAPGLTGFVLPRERLDEILVERAIAAGVTFEPETKVRSLVTRGDRVELVTDKGAREGAAAIVATGAVASITGLLQPSRHRAPAIIARYRGVPHDPGRIEMAFPRPIAPYYVWLFPEPDGAVNVGLMAEARGPSLHTLFDEVLLPHFGDRLSGAELLGRRQGASVCFASSIDELSDGRVLLAGEAAGLANGLSGEGIPHALESGELAARTLAEALADGRFGKTLQVRYRLRCERHFAHTLRRARAALRFFTSPLFPVAADLMSWRIFREASAKLLAAA